MPPSPPAITIPRCSGCGRCVAACQLHLITLETSGFRKFAVRHEPDSCVKCHTCRDSCPVKAIDRPAEAADRKEN